MQALWNRISSSYFQKDDVKGLITIEGLLVPVNDEEEKQSIQLVANNILSTREDIAQKHLKVAKDECLARTFHGDSIVVWYSKRDQLGKVSLNKRVSLITGQDMYGNVVITGLLEGYRYKGCPRSVIETKKKEESPLTESVTLRSSDMAEPSARGPKRQKTEEGFIEEIPFSSKEKKEEKKEEKPLAKRRSSRRKKKTRKRNQYY